MTASLTSKKNRHQKASRNGVAGSKAQSIDRLEKALSLESAADREFKALFRGINNEFGQMDIVYPNF